MTDARSVAVLMGGTSNEREVSLVSGNAVVEALRERGFDARPIDYSGDVAALIGALNDRPDVVFNALHGRYGEDGCIQGVLELAGLRYTHSGVLASALAMDKPMAKRLFVEAGIPCTEHVIATRDEILGGDVMSLPYVIKPLNEGSSVGVRIVRESRDKPAFGDEDWPFGDRVMVERYVPGREITVAVMGDRPLAVTELRPKQGFYDYDAKYTDGMTDHLIPAPIPESVYSAALEHAETAHRTLGCRGVSRADFRYDDTAGEPGSLYLLEINTQPGLTPLSLAPEQAAYAGIDFGDMVAWMVENASCDS
jgi:D-alanine-D-alanine ligase